MPAAPPEPGQIVIVRQRLFVVIDVHTSTLPLPATIQDHGARQHLVRLSSVEDEGLGEELSVVWELEPGVVCLEKAQLPALTEFDLDFRIVDSRQEIGHRDLLNAIFTCAARRAVTEREELLREVAHDLGFQRLGSRIQEMIASGINSAIRRGLIGYEGRDLHRLAVTYADLDLEALVGAVNATIKPGCVYTPPRSRRWFWPPITWGTSG